MADIDIDLERGGAGNHLRRGSEEGSLCFSDAEEGSCYSQFYSTADGSYDECASSEISESRRVSSVAESDYSVEIGNRVRKVRVERDCRICHLSLEDGENGIGIELGCSCKGDLAAAHNLCAQTWFKMKGNKICEICNSIATNIIVMESNETEPNQQANESNQTTTYQNQICINGHRIVNFLLACMVFAFVISWLFHFNIPS